MDSKLSILLCVCMVLIANVRLARCSLSEEEKTETLDFINHLRRNVVPQAGDMNGLLWDDNLENLAQKAANSCVFAHNYNGPYASLGEILYRGSRRNMSQILVFMFLEREIYNYSNGQCSVGAGKYPFFPTCGHYLQIASANVNKMGCGIKFCSGNYIAACEFDREWASPPYRTGEPGTKCGNGYATYLKDGLCYAILVGQTPPVPGPFECKLDCLNHGTLMTSPFCSCTCPLGFYGIRCEKKNIYITSTIPNDCEAQAVKCKNGGTPTMFDTTCKCVCPENYGGEHCEVNQIQESHSLDIYYGGEMRYASYYPLHPSVWNNTLRQSTQSHLTDAINSYCAANFSSCCPTATAGSLPTGTEYFATCEDFHVTENYPMQMIDGSLRVDVHYTMQANVAKVCNGNTESYIAKSVLKAAWSTAMAKINPAIAAIGVQAIRAE